MEKKTGELTVKPENKVEKKVKEELKIITFKENRKFDLHIGREVIVFKARESKPVPKRFLSHPDWFQVEKLFIVEKGE